MVPAPVWLAPLWALLLGILQPRCCSCQNPDSSAWPWLGSALPLGHGVVVLHVRPAVKSDGLGVSSCLLDEHWRWEKAELSWNRAWPGQENPPLSRAGTDLLSPGTCQHRASPWRSFIGPLEPASSQQVPVFAANRPETTALVASWLKSGRNLGAWWWARLGEGREKGPLWPGAITQISEHGAGAGVSILLPPALPRSTLEPWGRGGGVPAPPASPFSQ